MHEDKPVKSPEVGPDATQYLKATHVSNWVVLMLVLIFTAVIFAWSMLGTFTVTSTLEGMKRDDTIYCFVSVDKSIYTGYDKGQIVRYRGRDVGEITGVYRSMFTLDDVREIVDDDEAYAAIESSLGRMNAMGIIKVDADAVPDGHVEFEVVLSEMTPIQIVFQ